MLPKRSVTLNYQTQDNNSWHLLQVRQRNHYGNTADKMIASVRASFPLSLPQH